MVLAAVLVAAAGCGDSAGSLPEPLGSWPVTTVHVDGAELRVVVAVDTRRGLQSVTDLGELDGMLFDYGRDVDPAVHRFWMQDAAIPLDVAWFRSDGSLVGRASMPLCEAECPRYSAPGPFRWALETPAGSLAFDPGSVLEPSG